MDRSDIVKAVASNLALLAFTSAVEDVGEESKDSLDIDTRDVHPGPGGAWEEVWNGHVPDSARVCAESIVASFERVNGLGILTAFQAWEQETGIDDPDRFGFRLAAQSMGHGVGLSDDSKVASDWKIGHEGEGFYPSLAELGLEIVLRSTK